MARMAKHIARVVSRTTNEEEYGTTTAIGSNTAMTMRIFTFWVMRVRSLAAEQTGRLDRKDQDHRRIKREVGDFREQRLAEIVGEADRQRADGGAAQAAHAADDDDRERERQHFEVEAGINTEEGAAADAADGGQKCTKRENEHRDAVSVDTDAARHLRIVHG